MAIMEITGIKHDSLSDIANIRNILKGYGKGFPVIKELIQNAEDAGASILHIGCYPGFKGAKNPLLKCPALCMVNDGAFNDKDRDAIRKMGLGTKAGEEHAIGRFGLGIKSVFNYCEAFFYMASKEANYKEIAFFSLLSPWFDDKYKTWKSEDDKPEETLFECLADLLPSRHWFALWLPLRTKQLCNEVAPIIEDYPGEQFSPEILIDEISNNELPEILTLLKNLKNIFFSHYKDNKWQLWHRFMIDDKSKRSFFPEPLGEPNEIKGSVSTIYKGTQNSHTFFYGYEGWLNSDILKYLKDSDKWPKVVAIKEDGADPNEKEKALPHYGVIFTKSPSKDKGSFRVKWAVFLPVNSRTNDDMRLSSINSDITLLLHGYFFLNSERTNIDGLQDDFKSQNSVYLRWNQNLALEGTLNNILPAFDYFIRESEFMKEEIKELTSVLNGLNLLNAFKEYICKNYQWAFLLDKDGGKWRLCNAKEPIYSIPKPDDESLPYRIFPKLAEVTNNFNITYSSDYPVISAEDISTLTPDILKAILQGVSNDEINSDKAQYLKKLLYENLDRLNDELIRLIERLRLFECYSFKRQLNVLFSIRDLTEPKSLFYENQHKNQQIESLQKVCINEDIMTIN